MAKALNVGVSTWWRKSSKHFLALFWIAGLLFGITLYRFADSSLLLWMRRIPDGTVTIVGLLTVSVFPFLLSAFAVYIGAPALLLLICFGKAFAFSFVSCGIFICFDSAGWLIRCFMMCSSMLSIPVLYCFWRRYIPGERQIAFADVFLLFSLFLLLGSVDFCWISSFAANLI